MGKKNIIWGSIFLFASCILYEIEKILSYYKWASFITSDLSSGGYNRAPDTVSIFDNFFCTLFLVIAALLFLEALRIKLNKDNNNIMTK